MPAFVIEIYRPGVTESMARELAGRVSATIASMRAEGVAVQYLGCTLTPIDEVCFLRVESDRKVIVTVVAERAGLGAARISEIVEVAGGER